MLCGRMIAGIDKGLAILWCNWLTWGNLQVLQLVSWVCGPWRKFDLRPDYLGVARMWKAILKLQNNLSFQISSYSVYSSPSTRPMFHSTRVKLHLRTVAVNACLRKMFRALKWLQKDIFERALTISCLLSVANRGLSCSHPCRSRGGQLYLCTSTSLREIFGNTLAIAPLGVMWQWILAQLEVPTKS